MIYNNSENMEGLDASVLSVKIDLDKKISIVQERYTDIYNAIVSEYNSIVEFLDEFKRMANVIIDECNRLQGLTDEELTNIKKKIEELKNILDSIDIPDLPSIKPPDEFFGDEPDGDGGEEEDDTACHIGFGSTVTGTPPSMGGGEDEGGTGGSRFYCGEYDPSYGAEDEPVGASGCRRDFIIWGDGETEGTCVHDYGGDGEVPTTENEWVGCVSDWTDPTNGVNCQINYQVGQGNNTCFSGFSDPTKDYNCESYYTDDRLGNTLCDGYSHSTLSCDEGYFQDIDNGTALCDGYSASWDGTTIDCHGYFSGSPTEPEMCSGGFTTNGISCNNGYLNEIAEVGCTSGQNVTSCLGGYANGNVSCPHNWQESENNGNRGCQSDFSDGTVTCHNYYLTDGTFAGCGSGDNVCAPCIGTYCPSYSPSCTGCDNPRCYGCDDPNCYSNDGCGEGETPVVPPCGEGCGNCEAMCQGVGDAPSCGNYDEANCGSTATGAWNGCTEGQPICAGIWCGMSQA